MYLAESNIEFQIQKASFVIKNNDLKPAVMESVLSFKPFVAYLKNMLRDEPTVKSAFYRFVVDKFEREINDHSTTVPAIDSARYKELMELVYMILTPLATNEKNYFWALSTPVPDKIFFSTDGLYQFLAQKTAAGQVISLSPVQHYKTQQIQFMYRLILERLYHIPSFIKNEILFEYTDSVTNLPKFYNINTDTRFIDVQLKGKLPPINYKAIEPYLQAGADTTFLENLLPLNRFRFEGFSVITLIDVTIQRAVEIIREALVNHYYEASSSDSIIQALKMLAGDDRIDFGLIPSYQINGKYVFARAECSQSMVIEAVKKVGINEDAFNQLVNEYYTNPQTAVFNHLTDQQIIEQPLLEIVRNAGITSFALIPVFHNSKVAGILEVFSRHEVTLDDALLSRMEVALPLIAQLLKYSTDEFNTKIDTIIRDKFTPLQPSVQWKFNQAAWNFMEADTSSTNAEIETVTFEKVHPLYGAIDVRNSTFERNRAVREDIKNQLTLLGNSFHAIKNVIELETTETFVCACDRWAAELNSYLTSENELALNRFLAAEVNPYLLKIRERYPMTKDIVDFYFRALSETDGVVFENRRKLESSLQLINLSVSNYIENAQKALKSAYPFYFEKFRTDGIEYDMYIGQSMAPEKPFDPVYLKNLRLWQLTSMAEITRLTEKLLPELQRPLKTTQLIFIHSNPININFRNDERRFDVEGAYNIRYEIVKKRIDKALVHETGERLTQPGKIALVYFNDVEVEEYLEYIDDLQQMGLLNHDIEYLELESLQGVAGLKAIRIAVKHL